MMQNSEEQKLKQIDATQEVLARIECVERKIDALVGRVVGHPNKASTAGTTVSGAGGIMPKLPVLEELARATDRASASISRIAKLVDLLGERL